MVRSGEKLLNDLVIFLVVCPHGLGLTEISIVLKMIPSELTLEVKAKKIKLYLDLFRELAQKSDSAVQHFESVSDNS